MARTGSRRAASSDALGIALGLAGIPLVLLGIVAVAILFAAWLVPTGLSLLRIGRRVGVGVSQTVGDQQ
jgi:hypothetical protein